EDFAGMDDAEGNRPDADGVDADDGMLRVQANDDEMLAIESIEERLKKPLCSVRIPARDGRRVCQALLHQHHSVAGNRIGMLGWLQLGRWGFSRQARRDVGLRSLRSSRCH